MKRHLRIVYLSPDQARPRLFWSGLLQGLGYSLLAGTIIGGIAHFLLH